MSKKISRREFVETSAKTIAAGALLASGAAQAAKSPPKSKVIEVTARRAVRSGRKIDSKKVRQMVKRGMAALTGEKEPFKKLFSPKDKVGLKINCLGRPRIHTHHEVVNAFAEELKAAGVKPENIVVWDRFEEHMKDCGFKMKSKGPGVLVRATESYRGDNDCLDDSDPYVCVKDSPSRREDDSKASRLSRIFKHDCNKHINLAILKDHGLAGVTLCLKNIAFGVCDNNRRFHGPDYVNPFISSFCAKKGVMDRFTLHVIDGLEGCYDDGPCPGSEDVIFAHNTIWFSKDPVALDALGHQVIEARRKKEGLRSLKKSGRHPQHIQMAEELGLGNSDPARMNVEKIKLA
jgi:uncharacterized protein (DUF362 family)